MSPQQLEEDLDEALVLYMVALDRRTALKAVLAQQLKEGFFDLAQAKLALGAARVGPAQFDLSETLARFSIVIDELKQESLKTVVLSIEPTLLPPPMATKEVKEAANGLRQRSAPSSTTPVTTLDDSLEKLKIEDEKSSPRDPILQFSAFPPLSLRNAQTSFTNVIEKVLRTVEAEVTLAELDKKVCDIKTAMRSKETDSASP